MSQVVYHKNFRCFLQRFKVREADTDRTLTPPRVVGAISQPNVKRHLSTVGLLADAALAGADELDEVFDLGERREFGFDFGEGAGQGEGVAEQDFVGLF